MKEGLIEKIQSRGYWRVNFQPLIAKERLRLNECKEIVEKSSLDRRGWDYPHIPRRYDESSNIEPCENYYQAWEDWASFKEFWRMYQSGQFLYYRGLREDWFDEDDWRAELAERIKPGTSLALVASVIYEVTEMFEFLSRLHSAGLYEEGVRVNLTLANIKGRALWIEDPMRIPFHAPRITGAEKFEFSSEFTADDIRDNAKQLANQVILQVFARFGWHPTAEQVEKDQDKLLTMRM